MMKPDDGPIERGERRRSFRGRHWGELLAGGGFLKPRSRLDLGKGLAFAVALAFAPGALAAQPVVPDVGEEVRVVQRGQRGATHGLFVAATSLAISLSVGGDGEVLEIPRANVTGLSVQRGYRHHTLQGALLGIGVGVLGGIIVGQTTDSFDSTGMAVGASVAVGLPLGLLLGWLARSPEWDGVDLSALSGRPY